MKLTYVLILFYCCLMNACTTVYRADPARSAAMRHAITPSDTLIREQQKGVDFFATGNDPVPWSIELDLEKGFFFHPSNSAVLIAAPVQPGRLANTDTYITTTDLGPMKLVIYNEPCISNDKSSNPSIKTEVTINDKRFTGCGSW